MTLDRSDLSRKLVLAPRLRVLPDVLSVDEVARLLETAPGIKYRAALGIAYGAGLLVAVATGVTAAIERALRPARLMPKLNRLTGPVERTDRCANPSAHARR